MVYSSKCDSMQWFSPSILYSLIRSYFEIFFSILNHMVIPHKGFISTTEKRYDFDVFSHEPKRSTFSPIEKNILLQLVESEKATIEITTLDADSLYRKRQAWERITKQFNSYQETSKKNIYQLRNFWMNYKKQLAKTQRKQITHEQIGDGIQNNVTNAVTLADGEIVLARAHAANSQGKSVDPFVMDKFTKYRKNVEKLNDFRPDIEVMEKLANAHQKQMQDLQLKEVEKRYEIIEEESKLKLDILKLQLKQEQLKTMQAERDLEVQKQRNAILDLDIKQKKMDIEMREHLFREKQLKTSSKYNKRSTS